jgi:hypothetical protein
MGTSKSFPTPTGGAWTPLKSQITQAIQDPPSVSPDEIIRNVLRADGGIAIPSPSISRASGTGHGSSPRSRGASGGGTRGGKGSVSRAISGLGGFASAVANRGLDEALGQLGLGELRGKPAAEVVARVAEHLASNADGPQEEVLSAALREAIFEAAAVEDPQLTDLEAALQAFLNASGIEGLIELFLTRYIFNRVWSRIESHSDRKSATLPESKALASAVESACLGHVRDLVTELKGAGRFESVDWFGRAGQRFADEIASELERRLSE